MCPGLHIRISSVSPIVLWSLYAEELDFIPPLSCFVAYMPHCTGIYSLLLCLENFSIRIHIYEKEKKSICSSSCGSEAWAYNATLSHNHTAWILKADYRLSQGSERAPMVGQIIKAQHPSHHPEGALRTMCIILPVLINPIKTQTPNRPVSYVALKQAKATLLTNSSLK